MDRVMAVVTPEEAAARARTSEAPSATGDSDRARLVWRPRNRNGSWGEILGAARSKETKVMVFR